ncbi:MAG TPA: BlaI/MecI/CopY family transcriptional regulator [Candidatus Bathyarchaeia archaeon]
MAKNPNWIEFKPSEKDLAKVLGDLESAIMQTLWRLKAGDVKKIHKEVSQTHKVAITTVATVLDRLHDKGLAERELKKGKGLYYEYRPSLTQTQFKKTVVKSVFTGLFETFGDSAISYLIDNAKIKDQRTVAEFKRYLEKLKQEPE